MSFNISIDYSVSALVVAQSRTIFHGSNPHVCAEVSTFLFLSFFPVRLACVGLQLSYHGWCFRKLLRRLSLWEMRFLSSSLGSVSPKRPPTIWSRNTWSNTSLASTSRTSNTALHWFVCGCLVHDRQQLQHSGSNLLVLSDHQLKMLKIWKCYDIARLKVINI